MRVHEISNREVIASVYHHFVTGRHELIVAGDAPPMVDVFNDHTVWIEPAGNARSGTFRGLEEIVNHTAHCMEMTDGTWGTDLVEILCGDDVVVVIERTLALRNGASLNMLCSTNYQMTNGVVTELRVLPFDFVGWNTFWS